MFEKGIVGISLIAIDLNDGAPVLPFGDINARFGDCDTKEPARVPEPVTGEPVTENTLPGKDNPTLATVPVSTTVAHVPSPLKNTVLSAVPLPSRAASKVPDVIFAASSAGMSAATKARNVGVPEEPFGPEKTVFCAWLDRVPVIVPVVVIGLPLILYKGNDKSTLVTVPVPGVIVVQLVFVPSVVSSFPEFDVWVGNNAFKAAFAVVCPVPP